MIEDVTEFEVGNRTYRLDDRGWTYTVNDEIGPVCRVGSSEWNKVLSALAEAKGWNNYLGNAVTILQMTPGDGTAVEEGRI